MATGEAIVNRALDQLKSTLSAEDARVFSNTSLDDLWREARNIEKDQGARQDLRFMRRLEPLIRTLESYAGVIEVFCQGYAPMAFIWGPIKLMLLLARNYSNVMEKILQAFGDIADILPRLDRLKAVFPEDTNLNQVVGLIYSDIIEFHRRAYKFFRRKAWHLWFAFDWGLFERRFKHILQKLACHCDLLDKEAAAAHFSEMKQFRDKRQLEEDAYERQRQAQMAQDVFRWLSAAEDQQEEHLHRLSDKRQPETCNWILKDPQLQPWIENDCGDAVLWMTGIPGAGKSFLCSLLIEHLQSQQRPSTLYYFCSHQSSSANTCAIILRTLAYQLLQQNLDMASLIHQAYIQTGSKRSGPAMKKLLTQLLPSSKAVRIIIDGIDEGDRATQQEILRSLIEIQKNAENCCKLLVCSREEPQIKNTLTVNAHLKLDKQTMEGLSLYIKDRIKTLQTDLPWLDSALISLVEQRLSSKAKGMFLWVQLVTDTLSYQTSEQEFRTAINQLPEGLEKAYGAIQSRINSFSPILRRRAFTILHWVCVARRPISLHEVADGIVLRPGQTTLDRRTRSTNLTRDIIELCAPLLERLKSGVLELVHFSAKEYFIHKQSGPFIDLVEAHLNIAISSVINLTSCLDLIPRDTDGISRGDLESRVVQGCYGLQSYGQDFWAEHVLAYLGKVGTCENVSKELLETLEAFSRVWKHHAHTVTSLASTHHTAEVSLGLAKLHSFPKLHRFIAGWLHFKSELNQNLPSLNTLDTQEQWKLRTDETFLSLIDSHLRRITEKLLMMQLSQLPSHIDENDFMYFISRFRLPCRFQGCNHQCDTVRERDTHEESHVLSFPCLRCDFSGRGFRSRRDLEKHTQKYHMSAEDFEIPNDLHTVGRSSSRGIAGSSGAFGVSLNRSGGWSERGRKALRQGFHQVLSTLESEIVAAVGVDGESGPRLVTCAEGTGSGLSQHQNEAVTMKTLKSVRRCVEEQRYESLTDFKHDLQKLVGRSTMASMLEGNDRLESVFDDKIEKALSAFPAFASFDHKASKSEKIRAALSDSTPGQSWIKGPSVQDDDTTSPSPFAFGTRGPYWSLPEQAQFPELIQRYGRDFAGIADHLKTKTPKEVDEHFSHLLRTGDTQLSGLADVAEARIQGEILSSRTTMDARDAELGIPASDGSAYGNSHHLPQSSQPYVGPYVAHLGNSETTQIPIQGTSEHVATDLGPSENMDGPSRKKRRPPQKALCPFCSDYKEGLRDEYALKRHVERFHSTTRKVWVCEDISVNKRFLFKCKSCSANKRYNSKNSAGKHLRNAHFNAETSVETLQRWMREIEEPNPNMKSPSGEHALSTRPEIRTQNKGRMSLSLPPVNFDHDSPRLLPSMIIETNGLKPPKSMLSSRSSLSLEDNMDDDEGDDAKERSLALLEDEFFENDVFLEDISFDNLLSGNASTPPLPNKDHPPHRTSRALIRPDQITRLPNLVSYQKTACLDQVEALYHKLDNTPQYTLDYRQALASLISLSRVLMRNLRDWRQNSALAPHIPFSV